jgi:enolase
MKIKAIQIYDSRGKPTIEVCLTNNDQKVFASVPSGASTGAHEACELRDNDKHAFFGCGVQKAMGNVNVEISRELEKITDWSQTELDQFLIKLDGTKNKSRLGANAILGVSLSYCRLQSKETPLFDYIARISGSQNTLLPIPAFNVLNGGVHAENPLAFQEFMIIPTGAISFSEAMRMGSECYHCLKKIIAKSYGSSSCNVGDEGGFAPNISNPSEALDLIVQAIHESGYNEKISIGIDAAASGKLSGSL